MATKMKGIDVSGYQGHIDFKKVKASGVDFVIIKAGYHLGTVETWENNYANAKNNGLKVGAYWYSAALTLEEIKQESEMFIKAIKGKQLDFPVYLDFEEQEQFDKGVKFCSEAVKLFCTEMEKAGCFVGLYMSRFYLENYIAPEVRNRYALWVAEYSSKCRYSGDYGIWQYDKATVPGVENVCDRDWGYVDYSEIIKEVGFNGYPGKHAGQAPAKKTVAQIADEVINGDWGVRQDRYDRLTAAGYNYDEVQAEVNRRLTPKIKVGSRVKIHSGAKTYDNVKLAPFVYNRVYTVSELVNNRAVITYDGVVVAAVNVDDLVLA